MSNSNLYKRAAIALREKSTPSVNAIKTNAVKYDLFGWLNNQLLNLGEDVFERLFDRRPAKTIWVWRNSKWVQAAWLPDQFFTNRDISDMTKNLSMQNGYNQTLLLCVEDDEEQIYYLNGEFIRENDAKKWIRSGKFNA